MLAFEIQIDGKQEILAGESDWSLLSLHLTCNKASPDAPAESARVDYIDLSAGGLSEPDASGACYHFRWPRKNLKVGSVVTITIIETECADPPIKRYRSDREVQESPFTDQEVREMRWESYLELKKEFENVQS